MSNRDARGLLLSCYACAPGTGTEPGFGWSTAWGLAEAGQRVDVLTRAGNRAAIERDLASPSGDRSADSVTAPSFHYVELPRPLRSLREASGPHYLLWQGAALLYALRLRRQRAFSVVHHLTYGSLQGGSLLWTLGLPFVFGPAGGAQTAPSQAARYFGAAWGAERRRSLLTALLPLSVFHRLMARRTRVALATNEQTAATMRRLGFRDVRLFLDSGVSGALLAGGVPARPPSSALRILWVGRLLKRKAVRLALEAVSKLDVPFELTIVGDGPDAAFLGGWLHELGLEGRVSVRGRIPWEQVMALYREHDVFLFSSLRDSFGTQLLEAASQGLPIVCLDHHGAGDMLPQSAAIKVPLRSADDLAQDLAAALGRFAALSPELRAAMGEAGLEFARTHRWDQRAGQYRRLYRELSAP